MILRIIAIIILIGLVLFVAVPFVLYLVGVNIFPGSSVAPAASQKTIQAQTLGILMRSSDGGNKWENVALSENPTAAFPGAIYSFVIHADDSNVIYLGGAHSGLWKSTNGGRTWNRVTDASGILDASADVYTIKISSTNPNIIYIAAYVKNRGRVLKSEDAGEHFTELYATSVDKTVVFSIVVDPANIKHVLASTGEGMLIETVNGGQTWRIKKSFAKPLVRLVANPADIQELYAVNADGNVLKSVTGGNDWSDPIGKSSQSNVALEQYPPKVFDFFGSSADTSQAIFILDPSDSSRAYLAGDKNFLRSNDAGLTWHEMTLLFAKELLPVTAVAVDPHKSSTIFVSAASELQKSTDDGATWSGVPLPTGMSIKNLIIDPKDSQIMFAITGK